jgi:hypothetical protein
LVTASEAEALYFSQMRKDCRYSNMTVVWEQGYKDLSNLITIASKMRNSGNFSCVWVVFGFADLGVKPEQVSELLGLAEQKKVKLAWNNPSLPLWYLLHLQVPKGFVQDPKMIESALAKQFPSFTSDASYLLGEGMNLHLRLYSAKSKAPSMPVPTTRWWLASRVCLRPISLPCSMTSPIFADWRILRTTRNNLA